MDINDYLKIAKDYKETHNKTDEFVLMGLYKLIQETDLHRLHAHSLVSQQGDGSLSLITQQSVTSGIGFRTLTKVTNNTIFSVDVQNDTTLTDSLFGKDEDHALVARFNEDLQNVDSLFDLKDVYTFDEITRIKHLIVPSVSMGLAFELISQNNESNEIGKYNDGQYTYERQIALTEDVNYGKSSKFNLFSNDPLYALMHIKSDYPLTPETFFEKLNLTAITKIIDISGFDHISFDAEDMQELIDNDSPFIHSTFVGSLFKLDSLRDVMISYFDHQELDDVKFECQLRTDKFLDNPSIEYKLANDEMFKSLDDMLMNVYSAHPELNCSIQDIKIIRDQEIFDKKEVLEHHVDHFHLFESHRDILDLGPNMNDKRTFVSKYKLYGESNLLNLDKDTIRFISSNQFAADAIIAAKLYDDEGSHKELSIDALAINPQLSDEHITDLLNTVVSYAQHNKQVISLTMQGDTPWGGINKERFKNIVNRVIEDNKESVPFVCDFGKDATRYHLARNYLVDMASPYEELPKLLGKLKAVIDNSTGMDDLEIELEMDKFIAQEKIAQKKGVKALF